MSKITIVLMIFFSCKFGLLLAHADVTADYARLTAADDAIIQQANAELVQLQGRVQTLTQTIANAQQDETSLNEDLVAAQSSVAANQQQLGP